MGYCAVGGTYDITVILPVPNGYFVSGYYTLYSPLRNEIIGMLYLNWFIISNLSKSWLVGCGLMSHSAIFQLYSDGTVVSKSNNDLCEK